MKDDRPLRVGFRVGRFPALSETFVLGQIQGLTERGHRVSVLADEPGDHAAMTGVDYVLPSNPWLARAHGRLPYRVRRAHAAALERRLCGVSDVVVCNFGWAGAKVAASVAGRPRRARIVTIFHGDDMSRTLTQGRPDLYAELFREADVLASVSEFWHRRLLDLGAPADKLVVHRMGVDLGKYPFAPRTFEPGRPFRLVTVGRLVEKKGTEFALRALAELRRIPFRFRIVGDGPLRPQLESLAGELGLADRVEFLGALPHARVGEALAQADAFVLPSVAAADGDMEGIPVSLMEAMASGLPVVSTRHSGIPELVEDGVSGLLAEERDSAGLARHLHRIMSDAEGRRALARAARAKVERGFDARLLDDRLEAMLRGLVPTRRAAA